MLSLQEQEADVPAVLLTGHPMEEELKGLREEGLSGWLSKPPSLAQLAEVVSRALNR